MLLKRFMKFVNSMMKSNKPSLKFLLATVAADARSVNGSNLRSILLSTGVQLVPGRTLVYSINIKKLHEVPVGEEWKVPLIHSLIEIRSGDDVPDDIEIVDDVIVYVCTSGSFFLLHT